MAAAKADILDAIAKMTVLELAELIKQMEEKFKGLEVLPRPRQWGGFEVDPFLIEFWQGRLNRLHDRILYTKRDNGWQINRLAP